jgi:hypothetical protein
MQPELPGPKRWESGDEGPRWRRTSGRSRGRKEGTCPSAGGGWEIDSAGGTDTKDTNRRRRKEEKGKEGINQRGETGILHGQGQGHGCKSRDRGCKACI